MTESILDLVDMEVSRGTAVDTYHVSLPALRLNAGEVAAIVGPSGCGKSTLLEAIGLLLKPISVRRYVFCSEDLTLDMKRPPKERESHWSTLRQYFLGFVPQSGGLLPFLNVRHNIDLPRKIVGLTNRDALLEDVIHRLRLNRLLEQMPAQLSIGERQRVSFARAIAHRPQLLLADEPTAALDPILAQDLFNLIIGIARDFNIAALIVTHEWSLVRDVGIRQFVGTVGEQRRTVFDELS